MKHPKQNKSQTPKTKARQSFTCPDHPDRTFKSQTALASHRRHHQAGEIKAVPVGTGQQTIIAADPKNHLAMAYDQLVTRKKEIESQLLGTDALREESVILGKRIEAVSGALRAWEQSMAAAG